MVAEAERTPYTPSSAHEAPKEPHLLWRQGWIFEVPSKAGLPPHGSRDEGAPVLLDGLKGFQVTKL